MSRRSKSQTFPIDAGAMTLTRDPDAARAWLIEIAGTRQSFVDLDEPTRLVFAYMQRIAHVVDCVRPAGQPVSAIHLGGGGLTLPRYIAATRPGSRQRVFEIDAALIEHVRRELPLPQGARIRVRPVDALDGLRSVSENSADLVIADVFASGRTPAHLVSVELFSEAARVLRPEGVAVLNVVDAGPLDVARQQVANLQACFRSTAAFAEGSTLSRGRSGNVVLAGSRRPLPVTELTRRLAADPRPARLLTGAALGAFRGGYAARDLAAARANRRV